MASDYEAITQYNEEQLGKDTASRKSQVNMYSDPTHFVYEILQNADDYHATEVSFHLLSDKLIIEHNGIPFNTMNVKAISYFGKGTSEEDLVKTGHFGLGFKSVFAFTASPIIHSGDEQFEIIDLYRLRAVATPSDLPENCTRIILPFNHMDLRPNYIENYISPATAFNEISKRLKELNKISLLFTQHIREVKWVAIDEKGHYLRDDTPKENETYSPVFRKRKTTITDGESTQTYIVFSRTIQWYDPSTEKENQYKPVDIAFRLDDEGKSVSKTKHPLVVLFKTKIETHMGFLLNGPYRTTPNRETINIGDDFNQHLIAETATLLAETLPQLRDMGFMDINLLTTLPIVDKEFLEENEDNLFLPIYERVKVELCENTLLPMDDGNFVSAKQAKFADGEGLKKLISEDHLKALLNVEEPKKWLSKEITSDKTYDLWRYLRFVLNVEEVSPTKFARKITSQFLEEQTDEWMVQFYIYLDSVWKTVNNIIKDLPIIRLTDDKHVLPFKDDGSPNAYLSTEGDSDFPTLKRKLVDNEQARKFLKDVIGIPKPDIVEEVIERILPKYGQEERETISKDEHTSDISKILSALKTDSQRKKERIDKALRKTPFLQAVNSSSGEVAYKKPDDVYFHSPYLEMYFHDNSNAWFLNEEESKNEWSNLGVEDKPRFISFSRELPWDIKSQLRDGSGHTEDISIVDYSLDGLINFLNKIINESNPELKTKYAQTLWDFLLGRLDGLTVWEKNKFSKGEYCWFYYTRRSAYFDGTWLKLVRDYAWVPSKDGIFNKPNEISIEQLPLDFMRDTYLAERIGFKSNVLIDALTILTDMSGVELDENDIDFMKLLKENPTEYQRIKNEIVSTMPIQIELPTGNPPENPERYKRKITEKDRPKKKYERRPINQRIELLIDAKTWLKEEYKNEDKKIICQICKDIMPFKTRKGEYYFEDVESFDDFDREIEELHLALCPVCAAKYKEFIKPKNKNESGELKRDKMQKFKSAIIGSNCQMIPIELDKSETVYFTEKHLLAIKTLIEEQERKIKQDNLEV